MKNKWTIVWFAILAILSFLWKFMLVLLAIYIIVKIIKKVFLKEKDNSGCKTWR